MLTNIALRYRFGMGVPIMMTAIALIWATAPEGGLIVKGGGGPPDLLEEVRGEDAPAPEAEEPLAEDAAQARPEIRARAIETAQVQPPPAPQPDVHAQVPEPVAAPTDAAPERVQPQLAEAAPSQDVTQETPSQPEPEPVVDDQGMSGDVEGQVDIAKMVFPQEQSMQGVLDLMASGVAVLELTVSEADIFLATATADTQSYSGVRLQRVSQNRPDDRSRLRIEPGKGTAFAPSDFGYVLAQFSSPKPKSVDLVITNTALVALLDAQEAALANVSRANGGALEPEEAQLVVCFEGPTPVVVGVGVLGSPVSGASCS